MTKCKRLGRSPVPTYGVIVLALTVLKKVCNYYSLCLSVSAMTSSQIRFKLVFDFIPPPLLCFCQRFYWGKYVYTYKDTILSFESK